MELDCFCDNAYKFINNWEELPITSSALENPEWQWLQNHRGSAVEGNDYMAAKQKINFLPKECQDTN